MTRRGIHTKPNNGQTVHYCTPPEIVRSLGPFDLDPCAQPRQFYRTARRMIAPPKDGLAAVWKGRVWLNPPYGTDLAGWIERLASYGDGIALVPSRTEVESWFWPFVWEAADAVLFFRGRLYFYRPDGTKMDGNAGHGSVLAAYGQRNVEKIAEALAADRIRGRLVRLQPEVNQRGQRALTATASGAGRSGNLTRPAP